MKWNSLKIRLLAMSVLVLSTVVSQAEIISFSYRTVDGRFELATEDDHLMDPVAMIKASQVEVTVTPSRGQGLEGWYDYPSSPVMNPGQQGTFIGSGNPMTILGASVRWPAAHFAWIVYRLRYTRDGTTWETDPTDHAYTNRFRLADAPTAPVGHHFVSWTNVVSSVESFAAGETVTGESFAELSAVHVDGHQVNLAAKWEPDTTTISLVSEGVTNGTVSATYGQNLPSVTPPMRPGWTFGGYFTGENGSGTRYYDANGAGVKVWTETTVGTLYAKWTQLFTVTFYEASLFKDLAPYPDGVIRRETVPAGGSAERPDDPSHPGYRFTAWSGTYVDVRHDEKVYATYEANAYRVVFHANDGSGRTTEQPFEYGKAQALLPNPLPRTGHVLRGWSVSPESSTVAYQDGQVVSNLATEGAFDLYAVWEPVAYSVSFAAGGGTGTMDPVALRYGESYALPPCTFVPPTGCTFRDWALEIGGVMTNLPSGTVVSNLTAESGATVTATATWHGFYIVAFDGNGSDGGTMTNCVVERDGAFQLPSNAFVRANFHFGGWATNAAGTVRHADGAVVTNLAAAGETRSLFAVWQTNRCTVVFVPNPPPGASVTGTMDNQDLVYGQGQKLTKCAYSCGELWSFVGWSNTVSGAAYADEAAPDDLFGKDGATIGLKARWKSELSALSVAMGCSNLIWEDVTTAASADWHVGTWLETTETCAQSLGNGAVMSAVVRTNGVLRFDWSATGGQQAVVLNHGKSLEQINLTGTSGTAVVEVRLLPGDAFCKIAIMHRNAGACQVKAMTWTPEGAAPKYADVDTPISSFTLEDGQLRFTFSDDGGVYHLLGTNDVTAPWPWPFVRPIRTGAEVPLLPGEEKMFYRIRTYR